MPAREPRPARALLRALPALLVVLAMVAVVGPLTRGAHAATRVWGVDVADYQHPNGAAINWRTVKADGASFAMVKATEGTTYVNPYFASDWSGIKAAGLIRASYAFARPALPYSTAAAQARFFIAKLGSTDEAGDLPPMLDLEVTGGLTPAQLATWTKTWLQTVTALTGRTPMIYAGQYFWRDQVGNASGFTSYPWWLPAYSSHAPAAPYAGGWPHWTMWQYTSSAVVPGISGRVDASNFSGTAAQLASLADGRNTLIASKYASLGGAKGVLGAATGQTVAITGGFAQAYAHGAIVEQAGVAHAVWGPTGERYLKERAWAGGVGTPVADTNSGSGGVVSTFTGGVITQQKGHAVYLVANGIYKKWAAAGGLGKVGWPTSEGFYVGPKTPLGDAAPVTNGTEQTFAQGAIFASAKAGNHLVTGPILTEYQALKGADGPMGLPTTDVYSGHLGPQVDFQVGSIVYVSTLGRAVVA